MPGKWFITNLSSSAGIQPEDTWIARNHLSEDMRIQLQECSLRIEGARVQLNKCTDTDSLIDVGPSSSLLKALKASLK